jgi:hypothetical protein
MNPILNPIHDKNAYLVGVLKGMITTLSYTSVAGMTVTDKQLFSDFIRDKLIESEKLAETLVKEEYAAILEYQNKS